MTLRRAGLVVGIALAVLDLAPAVVISPAEPGTAVPPLAWAAAAVSAAVALTLVVLVRPAWQGSRAVTSGCAAALLVGVVSSLPAFFLPVDLLPHGAVLSASLGALAHVAVVILILVDRSSALLTVAAAVVTVAGYAAAVALAGVLLPAPLHQAARTTTALVVAIAFAPLLRLLRRTVGRSLYGGRATPSTTAMEISRTLDIASAGTAVGTAVDDIREALRLPSLSLEDSGTVLARSVEAGTPPGRTDTVPIGGSGTLVLRVGLRPGERRPDRGDLTALGLIAVPLGLLVRQSELTVELAAARAQSARIREAERARLHRDLHDGLGPLLTGSVMRVGAGRNLVPRDPARAVSELDAATPDLRSAVDEIRRVVHRLRPLELEDLGLWGALERRAARCGAVVHLPADPPGLSAAVEAAVYRIVAESLANVGRHAPGAAATVDVTVTPGSHLDVRISDDGPPVGAWEEGGGLASTRSRAEELGGRAEGGPTPTGWQVAAPLPFPAEALPDPH